MADIRHISIFTGSLAADLDGLPATRKVEIVNEFWPIFDSVLVSYDESASIAFFDYFKSEVYHVKHQRERFAIDDLEATIGFIRKLKASNEKPLRSILQGLSSTFLNVDEKYIQRSLELTVRLWLTINVNSPSLAVGATFPLESPLCWGQDVSINDLIQSRWQKQPEGQRPKICSQIDDTFTAVYLVKICGMTLQWTDYLTDHLTIDPQRRVLTVYKHKVYLLNCLKSSEANPIPREVLEEALDTLNLLFPFGDPATKQLLARQGQLAFYQLGNCNRERQLDPARYGYWKDELDTLLDSFNRPPRTWKQLATDQRNLMEWAAFWVTVMVALLTLVSIPCSIIQATYSVKAYHVALAQGNGCARC